MADTTKPNGLPFVRRDWKIYPASRDDHDGVRFERMRTRVDAPALAWYLTGDARHSSTAAGDSALARTLIGEGGRVPFRRVPRRWAILRCGVRSKVSQPR